MQSVAMSTSFVARTAVVGKTGGRTVGLAVRRGPVAAFGAKVRRAAFGRATLKCQAVAAPSAEPEPPAIDMSSVALSGLNGRPLTIKSWPTKSEVLNAIPPECFKRDTAKSLMYAAISTALTIGCGALAYFCIPMTAAYWPAWIAYGFVNGTIATGCWVVAHECGHSAFSDNKTLQDAVGYVLHSLLLVPYFSWQRSHAVHHAKTNHLTEGETHVPKVMGDKGTSSQRRKEIMGAPLYGVLRLITHLGFGWPAYLLAGVTGGPVRGKTNHFMPFMGDQGKHKLFPGQWEGKVYASDVGIVAAVAGLWYWASVCGASQVALLYGLPYIGVNLWLVLYTWLQHTDVDIPHYDESEWNFIKGALSTVDRPYGPLLDFLHHGIGSTHVAHHVNSAIPHYNAWKATEAIKKAFPEHYLYDPTPIIPAMWRVATKCIAVQKNGDRYTFAQ
eukprot:1195563-Prorocentrum_minimum.AAC.6